ncbi:MAG TPA: GNAT family N-acetyltransferase [Acidobacteriaceae bacterium]|nr:GNAT family N-acetyltransferase [Acidobacteriaceae bacterium]
MREILRTTEELESFRPEWEKLWSEDPNATPFQHPAWLLPWWRCFGQDEARAVVLRRDGRPVALLPFYIYKEPDSGKRRLLMIGASTTDYLDGVFAPECGVGDVLEAIQYLRESGGWDTMNITQVRPQSLLARALLPVSARKSHGERCWRIPVARVPDLPAKLRRNIMYYRNRAARRGTLDFRMANASSWADYFAALTEQHTAHWRERGSDGVLASPHVQAWHRAAIPQLQEAGLLRLCALCLDGVPIAVAYSLADGAGCTHRAQYFYLHTYSRDHAGFSPGTLLVAFAMEHAAEEGIEAIDLLRGDEAYKQLWPSEPVPTLGFALPSKELEHASQAA